MTDPGPRSGSRSQPPTNVGDSQVQCLEERPGECDVRIPRSRRPIAMEDDQTGDGSFYSVSSPSHPGGIALSVFEKAEALADNLEAQFQQVPDLSVLAFTVIVDVALRAYFVAPAIEPKLTTPRRFTKPSGVLSSVRRRPRMVSGTGP